MAELVGKLSTKISSDEEVLTLQELHSLLAEENNASQTDLSLCGLGDDASIELFGKAFHLYTYSYSTIHQNHYDH